MTGHVLALLLLGAVPPATSTTEENVDLATIHRIKNEAFVGSQVMDHLFCLTDVNGPRLTNSPGFRAAADWAREAASRNGASTSARLEKWGTLRPRLVADALLGSTCRSRCTRRCAASPRPGRGGTKGRSPAEVVSAPLFTQERRERATDSIEGERRASASTAPTSKGKLQGKDRAAHRAARAHPADRSRQRALRRAEAGGRSSRRPSHSRRRRSSGRIMRVPADKKKRSAAVRRLRRSR